MELQHFRDLYGRIQRSLHFTESHEELLPQDLKLVFGDDIMATVLGQVGSVLGDYEVIAPHNSTDTVTTCGDNYHVQTVL